MVRQTFQCSTFLHIDAISIHVGVNTSYTEASIELRTPVCLGVQSPIRSCKSDDFCYQNMDIVSPMTQTWLDTSDPSKRIYPKTM